MSTPKPAPCPRCGGTTIEAVEGGVMRGFVARCAPCWQPDVEAFRVAGAATVVFAPTARLAIEEWNRRVAKGATP